MKLFSYILSFLMTAPLFAQPQPQPVWNTLTTIQMQIPYGQSFYSLPLTVPRLITPFRITYVPSAACGQFTILPRVRYQGANTLSNVLTQSGGVFVTESKNVDLIEIRFQQNVYQWLNCQISIQQLASTEPADEPADLTEPMRIFAGIVDHAGGFVNRKPVTLQSPYYTQDIELIIPDYCSGYEATDLGVVTNTGTILLQPDSERARTFNFHLPKPMMVSHFEVSLLAPRDESCQIPVYISPRNRPH